MRARMPQEKAMDESRVRGEVDEHGVAEVVLARADKMNALDPAMFDALIDAIARVAADPAVRAVVVHGEGRAFCSGLDKASLQGIAGGGDAELRDIAARTHGLANRWQQVAWGWRTVPVPVI